MPLRINLNWCRGGAERRNNRNDGMADQLHGNQMQQRQQQQQQQQEGQDQIKHMRELENCYQVDWSKEGFLGKGYFAEVYRARDIRSGRQVAVKRISRHNQDVKALRTEIEALLRVQGHPNIVSLYDVFIDENAVILAMELLEGGELFSRIVSHGGYSERDASRHFAKITQALLFMHSHGIVHRDLKPENLVLATKDPDSEIKISDFGLSKVLDQGSNLMYTVCGTSAYAAPEVGINQNYDNRCDSWSLGVILYVILASYHPFDPYGRLDDMGLRQAVCTFKWDFNDKVWANMSDKVKDLIGKLLCPVEMRLSMQQILEHPWIKAHEELPQQPLAKLSSRTLHAFMSSNMQAIDQQPTIAEDDIEMFGDDANLEPLPYDGPVSNGITDPMAMAPAGVVGPGQAQMHALTPEMQLQLQQQQQYHQQQQQQQQEFHHQQQQHQQQQEFHQQQQHQQQQNQHINTVATS
ncbi:Protein kinase, putative [Hondaea fermentalgiana]|uniref:Protein kinase, putative n=1 Tax=Hondaea fermentalgiana TaxID=2315210 RepID=A0A2R5G2V8_9STRA|nr:Protein kinase, putative [Hondaea fermentalgiana]|eukprot:GBG25367.1 Protein kinase, putative [Hondaea fermentalgiana]